MDKWNENRDKLLIVWSSGDIEVANKMVLMYSGVMMERGYWDEAVLMVWGASVKLLSDNKELWGKIEKIKQSGVRLCACVACVDEYGVADEYLRMGIEAIHTGVVMTECLKDGWRSITF